MGSPEYSVTGGSLHMSGDDITDWTPDQRGRHGMFLAFQYPQEIPGVGASSCVRRCRSARASTCPCSRSALR